MADAGTERPAEKAGPSAPLVPARRIETKKYHFRPPPIGLSSVSGRTSGSFLPVRRISFKTTFTEDGRAKSMIALTDICHHYGKGETRRTALDGLTLQVAPGDLFALTGPNGSGKSTLFKILCGLLRPASGTIRLNGLDLFERPHESRRLLGVVFQSPALDKHLTVLENFRIHADLYGIDRLQWRQRLDENLSWTGLEGRLDDPVATLSGGMARRVELVKAILHRPRILLMDEPTTGLDPGARRDFLTAVRRLQREQGMTVLMTSHLFDEAERADRVAILHRGRLLAAGSPPELREQLGQEMVVVKTRDEDGAARLEAALAAKTDIQVQRRGLELRVEGIDGDTLQNDLLAARDAFQTLSIKRPTLEDLFIYLTGGDARPREAPP